ncbi:formylglycine-generating enzyme family protein [Nocardiopsis metallicus]|uniref:Formylglycine-generating enzyme required for sulfatase activity n=1 Tax=Nocardiopsis metallicus TaxID=179819 RepID=A0A840VZT7_9ACTN|nr:formylglycine-generating enzyme family protein [Nocardiopsis metallicus]MBB5489989.1 formylglycine-generating enzyme required for sulfatase activity [Nocardiopsis metallicus]
MIPTEANGMVTVPGGKTLVGAPEGERKWMRDHYPDAPAILHGTMVPMRAAHVDPFAIGVFSVTNSAFADFVSDGGYERPELWVPLGWRWRRAKGISAPAFWDRDGWREWRREERPVVGVSWFEADAYARWSGARLPSEAEWERAARGDDGRRFPWGDEFDPAAANTSERWLGRTITSMRDWQVSFADRRPWRDACLTLPDLDGDGQSSPFGVRSMSGNVWEWCADAQFGTGATVPERVCRGGSFGYPSWSARVFDRGHHPPWWRGLGNGFRCVRTPVHNPRAE